MSKKSPRQVWQRPNQDDVSQLRTRGTMPTPPKPSTTVGVGKVINSNATADANCAVPFGSSLLCHSSKGIVLGFLRALSSIARIRFNPIRVDGEGFAFDQLQATIQAFFPLHLRHRLRPTGVHGRLPLQQSSAKPCQRALFNLGFLIFADLIIDCPHVLAKHNPNFWSIVVTAKHMLH